MNATLCCKDCSYRQYAPQDMTKYIGRYQKLTELESRKFFRQLVSAIEHAHKASIVHRDLKLENLLLDAENNLILSDFGLGRKYLDSDPLSEVSYFKKRLFVVHQAMLLLR